MACYEPLTHLREVEVAAPQALLLFVDIQNYTCHPDGALHRSHAARGKQDVSH